MDYCCCLIFFYAVYLSYLIDTNPHTHVCATEIVPPFMLICPSYVMENAYIFVYVKV